MASHPELFPFGAPVLPRPPSASEPRRVYVLGAYPSGLHIRWTAPPVADVRNRTVRALLVDNEPTPFWTGDGESERFEEWKSRVGWRSEWGDVGPPGEGTNGPSGQWVEQQILRPLGLSRDEVCISDCLDTARLNPAQAARVRDTYEPVAGAVGLPSASLPPVPDGERGVVREAKEGHLDRLRAEIEICRPSAVITLGNAASRVFSLLGEDEDAVPGGLTPQGYGEAIRSGIGGRPVTWLRLVHPRSGERTPRWRAAHATWLASRPTLP